MVAIAHGVTWISNGGETVVSPQCGLIFYFHPHGFSEVYLYVGRWQLKYFFDVHLETLGK